MFNKLKLWNREPFFYSNSLTARCKALWRPESVNFFLLQNRITKSSVRCVHLKFAGRTRPLNRFKIHRRPKSLSADYHRRTPSPLCRSESEPKFIMFCANVQSVANICAPPRFTNAGTHRALAHSIDITPLTQATVPSMKHNHFISRTAAFSAAQTQRQVDQCADVCVFIKEILSINTCIIFILYSISRVRNSRVLKASKILYYILNYPTEFRQIVSHWSSFKFLYEYFEEASHCRSAGEKN